MLVVKKWKFFPLLLSFNNLRRIFTAVKNRKFNIIALNALPRHRKRIASMIAPSTACCVCERTRTCPRVASGIRNQLNNCLNSHRYVILLRLHSEKGNRDGSLFSPLWSLFSSYLKCQSQFKIMLWAIFRCNMQMSHRWKLTKGKRQESIFGAINSHNFSPSDVPIEPQRLLTPSIC